MNQTWLIKVLFLLSTILLTSFIHASNPRRGYYVIDSQGNRLMPDSINLYDGRERRTTNWEIAALYQTMNYGDKKIVIDSLGNAVYSFTSGKLSFYHSSMFAVYDKDDALGFRSPSGEIIIPHGKYYGHRYKDSYNDFCVVGKRIPKDDGEHIIRWGVIDLRTGEEVIVPQYHMIRDFKDNCWIIVKDGKYGLVNVSGKEIFPPIYDEIKHERSFAGAASFEIDGEFYLIDGKTARVLIKAPYIRTQLFPSETAFLEVAEGKNRGEFKYALMNRNFELITPYIYDEIVTTPWGAEAKKDGVSYYIDKSGKIAMSNPHGVIFLWPDYIYVEQPYGYDFYSYTGEKIREERYKIPNTAVLSSSYADINFMEFLSNEFKIGFKVGFKNEEGELVIPRKYRDFDKFENDRIIVAKAEGKIGVIDINNKVVIPLKYDEVLFTDKGGFVLTKKNESFFVDENGNRLTDVNYQEVDPIWYNETSPWFKFRHHFEVKRDDKWTIADGAGQEFTPFFDKIGLHKEVYGLREVNELRLTTVCVDGKWGIWNLSTNEEFLPCEYEDIFIATDEHIQLKNKGRWALCNLDREILTEFRYDYKLSYDFDSKNKRILYGRVGGYSELLKDTGEIIFKATHKKDAIQKFHNVFIIETEGER